MNFGIDDVGGAEFPGQFGIACLDGFIDLVMLLQGTGGAALIFHGNPAVTAGLAMQWHQSILNNTPAAQTADALMKIIIGPAQH